MPPISLHLSPSVVFSKLLLPPPNQSPADQSPTPSPLPHHHHRATTPTHLFFTISSFHHSLCFSNQHRPFLRPKPLPHLHPLPYSSIPIPSLSQKHVGLFCFCYWHKHRFLLMPPSWWGPHVNFKRPSFSFLLMLGFSFCFNIFFLLFLWIFATKSVLMVEERMRKMFYSKPTGKKRFC